MPANGLPPEASGGVETDLARALVGDAIAQAMRENEGSTVVTGWVLIAETIDEDGEVFRSSCSSFGTSRWWRIGLLQTELDDERGIAKEF